MSARDVLGVLRARDDADDEAALRALEGDEPAAMAVRERRVRPIWARLGAACQGP